MNRRFLMVSMLCSAALGLAGCTTPSAPGDTTKPGVTLGLGVPLNQSEVGVIHLKAEAVDNVGVTQVSFYQGSRLLGVDTNAPYEAQDSVTTSGTYRYRAVARDAAGNTDEALLDVTLDLPLGQRSVAGTLADYVKVDNSGLVTSAWTGGAGTVSASVNGAPVASTPLNAAGAFALSLPETLPATALSPLTPARLGAEACQTPPASSPTGAQVAAAQLAVQSSTSGPIWPVSAQTQLLNDVPKAWYTTTGQMVYADRAVNVTGTSRCQVLGREVDVTFALNLLPGWNKVLRGVTINTNGTATGQIRTDTALPGPWLHGVTPEQVVRPLPTP